jgi:hypothetical protein
MCRAEVSGELIQSVVSNKDTGRDVQYAVFSIEALNGGATASRVTFAKDFLKVPVQKLNNSIIHSSIPCPLCQRARTLCPKSSNNNGDVDASTIWQEAELTRYSGSGRSDGQD